MERKTAEVQCSIPFALLLVVLTVGHLEIICGDLPPALRVFQENNSVPYLSSPHLAPIANVQLSSHL